MGREKRVVRRQWWGREVEAGAAIKVSKLVGEGLEMEKVAKQAEGAVDGLRPNSVGVGEKAGQTGSS